MHLKRRTKRDPTGKRCVQSLEYLLHRRKCLTIFRIDLDLKLVSADRINKLTECLLEYRGPSLHAERRWFDRNITTISPVHREHKCDIRCAHVSRVHMLLHVLINTVVRGSNPPCT